MALRTAASRIYWQSFVSQGTKSFPFSGRWRSFSDTTGESDSALAEFEPTDLPVVTATPVESINEADFSDKSLKEFRVSNKTDYRSLATAIFLHLQKHGVCDTIASGDESLSRFIKGVSIARYKARMQEADDIHFQANHCFW